MILRLTLLSLGLLALSACQSAPVERSLAPQEPAQAQVQTEAAEKAARVELQCKFQGQRFLKHAQLMDALEFELQAWTGGSSIAVVADDCSYQLSEHYRSLGFASATIQAEPGRNDAGPTLTFTIDEGLQTLIAEFAFPGLDAAEGVQSADLQDLYSPEARPVWIQRQQGSFPGKVKGKLQSVGYLDAAVQPAEVEPMREASNKWVRPVRLTLPVQPGPRYRWTEVVHDLPEDLAEAISLEKALDQVVPQANVPFQPRWIPHWKRAADTALTGSGYLDAEVQTTLEKDVETSRVRVQLRIEPGPQVKLGSILYPDDIKVRTGFLDRQIGLQPGAPLSAQAVDQALASLYRTGLFRTVRLRVQGSGSERDLAVELEEWPTRETFIEPGYGSFEGARLRAGWRHHNVLGVGRSLRVEGVLAENASRALIGWSDPWTLGNEWVLDVNADLAQRKLPAFRRNSSAAGMFASRDFGDFDRWTVHGGLRFEEIRLNDVRVDLLPGTGIESDVSITTLESGVAYDSRNHPLLPSQGQKAHFTVQQTLNVSGAANAFAKVLSGWSFYHPIAEDRVLAVGARTVAVFPRGGEPHPLGLRIFSGGENSVRSFKESELGPVDSNGTAVGGEGSSTFSVELTQRLGASHFQAAAFVDVGNVVTSASELFEFKDMESALGVGLRYVLPIGPMRLDWAHNPDAKDFQDDWVLHFSVGVAF
ncbi:MAG: BamA/TamA family outer membrane protein [Planctomycetota bacterium]|nr:BamA/TamA family outer membrane protein [Planctomycetota bacterium]